MTPEQWAEVRRLFEALCDLPEEERARRLAGDDVDEAVRRQVVELFEFDDASGLERLAEGVGNLSREVAREDLSGERLGAWRLLSLLGEGGMGEVYLAERADGRYEARVAIKFLALSGRRARHLFERERRILARLQHPAIAHLIDAGEHPRLGAWLAMAYVDGNSLGTLAAEGSLAPAKALACMIEAARAVAFAHRNLVLHRDLKPDHLVLDLDGQLRILDFGVATLLDGGEGRAEQTGRASFTLRYAAPEQILGQATTTRTDIYALGLILHELLSGGSGAFGEEPECLTERKLSGRRDRLACPPGLGRRRCRDLDAVVGRCLAVAPENRYAGADELADDLAAVLADRPVLARRAGWLEMTQRWLARHRLAGAMLAFALLAVAGGSAFSTWFALQARTERNAAVAEAAKARQITAFLEGIFQTAAPGVEQGPETTVRELLERGRKRIGEELAGQPEIAGHLERAIATSYMFLGMHDEALEMLDQVLPGEPVESVAKRRLVAARVLLLKGQFEQAVEHLDAAAPGLQAPLDRAAAKKHRATAEINLGQAEAARRSALAAIELADDSDEGVSLRLSAQNLLGVIAYNAGDYAGARLAFEAIYRLRRERDGEMDGATGLALHNLAGVVLMQGDLDAALGFYQRALAILEHHFGVDNQAVAMVLRSMGVTHRRRGEPEAAEKAFRRSLAAYEQFGGRQRHVWRDTLLQLVELLILVGREAEAAALLDDLPEIVVERPAHERQIVCRLELARHALNLPASVCPEELEGTEGTRAVAHFLNALNLQRNGRPDYTDERERARRLLTSSTQPDPLLLAAIDSL